MIEYWILAVLSAIGGSLGGYIGAYTKKKGENRAIHEDLSKLVEQMKAVTQSTKEIEAKISSDVWDRQKAWELKRDILLGAIKGIAALEDALIGLDTVLQVEIQKGKTDATPGWLSAKHEKVMKWGETSTRFDETKVFVAVVCGDQTATLIEEFGAFALIIAQKINKGKDATAYRTSYPELFERNRKVRAAIRKELGIEDEEST